MPNPDESDESPEVLHQHRRDRWATPLASFFTAIHACTGLFVLGWYYFIVPRVKYEFDDYGVELSQSVITLIMQSDLIVNYWYLMVPVGPPVLVIDFLVIRWLCQQNGRRWAILCGISITAILLVNMAYGQFVLSRTKELLINQISAIRP